MKLFVLEDDVGDKLTVRESQGDTLCLTIDAKMTNESMVEYGPEDIKQLRDHLSDWLRSKE